LATVVDHLVASDANHADAVTSAANTIISKANHEVLIRSNNGDAIMSALKGLNVPAPAMTVPSDKVPAPAVAASRDRAVPCDPTSLTLVRGRAQDYKDGTARTSAAANALSTLATACAVAAPPITALALDSEEITVSKDGRFNVNISGGREPYIVTAVGSTSPNLDVSLVPPHTIVIVGRSTISGASGPFLYQVKDNSAVSTPKTLKVSTK